MLLIQIKKVLPINTYTVIGIERTFGPCDDFCFETFFAGPAKNIPDKYDNKRIKNIYPDKNGSQVIELER